MNGHGQVYPRKTELKAFTIGLTREQALAFAREVHDAAIAAETVTIAGWRERDQITVFPLAGRGEE